MSFQESQPQDDWFYIGRILGILPRAIVEGVAVGATIAYATYYKVEDAWRATAAGASTGLLWVYGRCAFQKHRDHKQAITAGDRFETFSGLLPKDPPAEVFAVFNSRG